MSIAEEIIRLLQNEGINFFTTYPCAKIQHLYHLTHKSFRSIGVTKEEEGVGICAGVALAGAKPAMLIQSTGLGNMINALSSLTLTYQLPLLVITSWRGVQGETVIAQKWLGQRLPQILQAVGIRYHIVDTPDNLSLIAEAGKAAYSQQQVQVIFLHPKLWKHEKQYQEKLAPNRQSGQKPKVQRIGEIKRKFTRFKILQALSSFFDKKLVISNIGFPSRELYVIKSQPSNFYMLGSLGLVSSIGLGVALFTSQQVVVIDGDGSLLSNLGSLATIAESAVSNLVILAIDNGVHGSTGNQLTPTSSTVDLAQTALALGLRKIYQASALEKLTNFLSKLGDGPNFVHILARPGNADVPIIPLSPGEIRDSFSATITNAK